MIAAPTLRVRSWLRTAEAGIGSRRGALAVFGAGLLVFAIESVWLPVLQGRDFGTYMRYYAQLWDWHSAWPMTMLYRTPLAPLVVGLPLDVAGGWGAEVVMALLFAASVLAWSRVALAFGGRAALLATVALLLYPGYAIVFHELSSDSVAAAAFAAWALALARAVQRPTSGRFAVVGLAVVASSLARPAHQVLAASVLVPLALDVALRLRLAAGLACAAVVVALLGGWAINNGLRYGDYTVARGGKAFFPLFRALTTDHIVEPDNGSASRELAAAVSRDLLPEQPYRSYRVTVDDFFANATDREFEDLVGLSDRVWGWDSDYAKLRSVGLEAVRAHPATYAKGVLHTIVRELWHPLYVSLPRQPPAASSAPAVRRLTGTVTGAAAIPAAHQGLFSTTPDGHIREVWTSAVAHTVIFDDPADQRRHDEVEAKAARLGAHVPAYRGNVWLTRQFSRSSRLFPPPLLWLVAGLAALLVRRPAHRLLAVALALGALAITVVNALTIYSIIEFAVPLAPALIVFGAAGLAGARSRRVVAPRLGNVSP